MESFKKSSQPERRHIWAPNSRPGRRWLFIDSEDAKPTQRSPRIALADWLTDEQHGAGRLLARVIVNRLWQHHMGRGIVAARA